MAPAPADAAAAAAPAPSNLELEGVFVGQGLIAAVINRLASPPVKCDNDNYSCGAQCLDDDPTACYHDCDIAFERCVWCDVPNYNTCMTNCTVDHTHHWVTRVSRAIGSVSRRRPAQGARRAAREGRCGRARCGARSTAVPSLAPLLAGMCMKQACYTRHYDTGIAEQLWTTYAAGC